MDVINVWLLMNMAEIILIMPHLLLKVTTIKIISFNLYMSFVFSIVLPPEVSIIPAEVQVRKRESIEFFCLATGFGANNFIYQWFLNDLPVVAHVMPTLVINDVTEIDTGDYVCFVRNSYGGIGQSAVARLILGK